MAALSLEAEFEAMFRAKHAIGNCQTICDRKEPFERNKQRSKLEQLYNQHLNLQFYCDQLRSDDNYSGGSQKGKNAARNTESGVPIMELSSNASNFAVYASVRQAVIEHRLRQAAIFCNLNLKGFISDENADNDTEKPNTEPFCSIPKMVGVGLSVVFELIRESRSTNFSLCSRALHALLDTLQGLQPEGLKNLSSSYQTPDVESTDSLTMESLMKSFACSSLLSLVVARGDTGKMLTAVSALLTNPHFVHNNDEIETPAILMSLQRCVHTMLLGKTTRPHWLTHGFPKKSLCDSFIVQFQNGSFPNHRHTSLAFDGKYLYIYNNDILHKIGSGYGGTLKGQCVMSRKLISSKKDNSDCGWIGYVRGYLYFQSNNWSKNELIKLDTESLKEVGLVTLGVSNWGPSVCTTDGDFLLLITAAKDDSFILRTLKPSTSAAPPGIPQASTNSPSYLMPVVQELPLKLAHKCFIFCGGLGNSIFENPAEADSSGQKSASSFKSISVDDEIFQVTIGKDFAVIRCQNGKVFFSGKAQSLGIKQNGIGTKWSELPITKSPKISNISVGHESAHCLLVSEDGSVYFAGLAKRGEDGDQYRGRRQPKAVKPKKMIKMEGKIVVQTACNHGTSALVTKDGELYMFGKDANHSDKNTGQVTTLKNVFVTQVSLGKAHTVVLSNKGHVFTFGFNHKGQCGHDHAQQSSSVMSTNTAKSNPFSLTLGSEENDLHTDQQLDMSEDIEPVCASKNHRWKYDQCMICTSCGECTGYGPSCVASGRSEIRNPGMPCGCGAGDSGCADCGICKACDSSVKEPIFEDNSVPAAFDFYKDSYNHIVANAIASGIDIEINPRNSPNILGAFQEVNDPQYEELGAAFLKGHLPASAVQKLNAGLARLDRRRIALDAHLNRRLRHINRVYKNIGNLVDRGVSHDFESIEMFAPGVLGEETNAGSDCENSKLSSLPPTKLNITQKITQIACGLHHTVLLSQNGEVFTFGSNQQGQLGVGDFVIREKPVKIPINATITQIAAGSNHTVLLTSHGQVYTFGSNQKGQLGRSPSAIDCYWNASPGLVPNIGSQYGRRATWIGASGYYTFIKVDESLINPSTLPSARVLANKRCIVIVAPEDSANDIKQLDSETRFNSLVINRADGVCKTFATPDQLDLSSFSSVCLDDLYDILWTYNSENYVVNRYNIITSAIKTLNPFCSGNPFRCVPSILSPEIALPNKSVIPVSIHTTSLNLLCALETLTTAHQLGLTVKDDEQSKNQISKTFNKDDFSIVNRFESHGGGWGYSGHSVEAIRFMADSDIIVGGFGLFGGRGEYIAKLRLFDIGLDGGEQEGDGEILVETDEVPYECAPRHKYPILFEEPVQLQANRWYVAWARISGPSSDCGSSGQSVVNSEDQVTFYFKSSKKSNNGTDVNAGQIPQILYKTITSPEQSGQSSSRAQCDQLDKNTCLLSREFSMGVTTDCFTALLRLLRWSWQSFKANLCEMESIASSKTLTADALISELRHLGYISCACLHLLQVYVNEIFPSNQPTKQSSNSDLSKLADCVGDTRTLMKMILSDPPNVVSLKNHRDGEKLLELPALLNQVMGECQQAFMSCYQAFYPSPTLRWRALCDLLLTLDVPWTQSHTDNLLAAMLASLCTPAVRLISTFPLYQGLDVPSLQSPSGITSPLSGNNGIENIFSRDPILVEKMLERSDKEGCHSGLDCSFRDVLVKLLAIVGQPIECLLFSQDMSEPINEECQIPEQSPPSSKVVEHTCNLLSALLSELVAQATGIGFDIQTPIPQTLHVLPSRFSRVSQNRTWNTGNGSPDAICFSVDRPSISIVGITVYGGVGSEWHYELELLDYQGSNMSSGNTDRVYRDPSQNHQWRTIETCRGTYTIEDKSSDVTELRFERPIPIREKIKYAIRLKNRGPRTNNGDGGLTHVRGPDGTTFTFSDCSLSYNGTNHTRGQIPQILYYSSPPNAQHKEASTNYIGDEFQARKNILAISEAIFVFSVDLLHQFQEIRNFERSLDISSSHLVSKLLPSVLSLLAPIATTDPKIATQILSMVKQLLPLVCNLNKISDDENGTNANYPPSSPSLKTLVTTSKHYVIVESDHPYKPAGISSNRVSFPKSIKWMSLEFDSRSGTAQPEDVLKVYFSSSPKMQNTLEDSKEPIESKESPSFSSHWILLRKFSGRPLSESWPISSVLLPGNEVLFSLETASDYVKDDKACYYGFRCQVIGYENPVIDGLYFGFQLLEQELQYLGAICVSSLLSRSLVLPPLYGECEHDDEEIVKKFQTHSALLFKGLNLAHPPTALEALEGVLPLSHEKPFLKDFVHCTPGTSGGRLAAWLQPESYVDPSNCEITCISSTGKDIQCGWPTIITITTKDQYGNIVNAPFLKVEVFAQPFHTNTSSASDKQPKVSKTEVNENTAFGGLPPPPQSIAYAITCQDKMMYHAITMMKVYENYSFEELRFAAPIKKRNTEAMLVRPNNDGTYIANWTPGTAGWYQLKVLIDGTSIGASHSVQVGEAPKGTNPVPVSQLIPINKVKPQPCRKRKFIAKNSSGLRVRALPSLQSEQIGIIQVNDVITISDELENDDGIWVRLSPESVKKFCNTSQQNVESWCLQYNQHLGKKLLIPVDENKRLMNGVPLNFIESNAMKRKYEKLSHSHEDVLGLFHVIKCGVSGHNIRSRPNLRAPPIGALVLGNVVGVIQSIVNMDGKWLKLDDESKKRYCFNSDGDAWTLAQSASEVQYLQHEAECMHIVCTDESDSDEHKLATTKTVNDFVLNVKDLASTPKDVPSLSNSGNIFDKSSSVRDLMSFTNLSHSGASESEVDSLCSSSIDANASITSLAAGTFAESEKTETDSASSTSSAATANSRIVVLQKKLTEAGTTNVSPARKSSISSSHLPELIGVSVKELVKAIGSREGSPTPPGTPSSKHSSRSSSPITSLVRRSSATSASQISTRSVSTRRTTGTIVDSTNSNNVSLTEKKESSVRQMSQKSTQTSPPSELKVSKSGSVSDTTQSSIKSNVIIKEEKSTRQARSKRERPDSPVLIQSHLFQQNSQSIQKQHPIKEAMSNCVAECLRAVFAAFIWHEGILHDAMAAASYLKFNANISKTSMKKIKKDDANETSLVKYRTQSGSSKQKARFRHSLEVSQLSALQQECYENGNLELNKPISESDQNPENLELKEEHQNETEIEAESHCVPETLVYLLTLWEGVSKACLVSIANPPPSVTTPNESPAMTPVQMFNRIMPNRHQAEIIQEQRPSYNFCRKRRQAIKSKHTVQGYLNQKYQMPLVHKFEHSQAALANGIPKNLPESKDLTVCELCGNSYPYPVTHHMRQAHPGCGEHSGGKGYNSSGSFCGGWAGHCGDGGIATSNWYLICDRCRDKFMSMRRTVKHPGNSSDSNLPTKSDTSSNKPQLTLSYVDVHQIVKENALFLLKLASASEDANDISIPQNRQIQEFSISSSTFQCLEALGIHQNIYKQRLAEEHLSEDEIRAIQNGRPSTSDYDNDNKISILTKEAGQKSERAEFHRSVSIGLSEYPQEHAAATLRKRATSNESTGTYLLCQPSSPLTKLIKICEQQKSSPYSSRHPSQSFPLQRPVLSFVFQQHDLNGLSIAMKNAIRKVACRSYALNALNWLLRTVTQPVALHDLMWSFVCALTPRSQESKAENEENPVNVAASDKREALDSDMPYHSNSGVSLHPVSDLVIAGDSVKPLLEAFHSVLQTISDIMPLLPIGSPLQQIAIRCFCLHFEPSDHSFLHRCHVFSNISKILSRGEEETNIEDQSSNSPIKFQSAVLETLQDITQQLELKASSRQAMIGSLTDNSTETFWESGDEDRNKMKVINVLCNSVDLKMKFLYIHIDNCRDLGSKISQVTIKCGSLGYTEQQLMKLETIAIDNRFAGWLNWPLPHLENTNMIRIEMKGPDNTLRLRQVKILGFAEARIGECIKSLSNYAHIQQLNCESETLRVFRLLTSQVFGKLISGSENDSGDGAKFEQNGDIGENGPSSGDGTDLREHMVGILFSRSSKLTNLQKQVCSHIVQSIRVETLRVREEWETLLCSKSGSVNCASEIPLDAYCFELLSMVLALSGSKTGRQYLSQQNNLLLDLLSLLHTGSARVQRQVTSLLRRVLPEIQPTSFAAIVNVDSLPPSDFLAANNKEGEFDLHKAGVLDVFLACIAKALTVQTKIKGTSTSTNKGLQLVTLATSIHPRDNLGSRWWLRGCMSRKLAEVIIQLLKDMAVGKLGEQWASITRNATADSIINLTRMTEKYRYPHECMKTPTLWLALASLCVLDQENAERLSSSHWVASAAGDQANGNQPQQPSRPCCDNHDDNETLAIILCTTCGNLCGDCDRYLHLHRKTRTHQRQIFKEEEEAIKVDLHEGCGRTKLFWLMALADSKTLKAMVEFRGESNRTKLAITCPSNVSGPVTGICRFCGATGTSGLLAIGNVCGDGECQEHARNVCEKTLNCGHPCNGVKNESPCLPCLHGCSKAELKQDGDDMCMICFTEALSCAPVIQLHCGHLFHLHCCKTVLQRRWPGPRITFSFSFCPICKEPMSHPSLEYLLESIRSLYEDVKRKALMRLEYEGLDRSEAITTPGARFFNNPIDYAMERYAYYVCHKCEKAYYGGEARCDAEAGIGEDYDPSELVCGACSDVTQAQMCPKHGTDFLEYKCRYCCSVAVFFCFGTTHFCNACHDDFQRVTNIPKQELPQCPAGPRAKSLEGSECPLHVKHPPTGEEFALGCGVCRNAHTF
ncbi:E3 ubiquitin-protein ligase MYCBP2-like isoform X4 [Dinothrombium tinctorium]|uniref:RCR-type E3 ubiquitin transferase n=1 Tax=Dinothrombium tinctorium TaxID=1965070 RepID=A0A3S4RKN2_9ACAR|nr:E3 ubiquitin-protein ligase MYCBP2-like isoform X4 [Dinothrombium tinctorium]